MGKRNISTFEGMMLFKARKDMVPIREHMLINGMSPIALKMKFTQAVSQDAHRLLVPLLLEKGWFVSTSAERYSTIEAYFVKKNIVKARINANYLDQALNFELIRCQADTGFDYLTEWVSFHDGKAPTQNHPSGL